jgi:anthranilate/para-aminobenzoate synthase component I
MQWFEPVRGWCGRTGLAGRLVHLQNIHFAIRAIDIIYELESIKRGIYAGAIGYLGWNGNMDTAIAIRTCVIKDGKLNIQCGAGIVNDSIAELEWEETLNKGKAIVQAYKNLRNK